MVKRPAGANAGQCSWCQLPCSRVVNNNGVLTEWANLDSTSTTCNVFVISKSFKTMKCNVHLLPANIAISSCHQVIEADALYFNSCSAIVYTMALDIIIQVGACFKILNIETVECKLGMELLMTGLCTVAIGR